MKTIPCYEVFSSFRAELSLNNRKDFFVARLRRGALGMFSCSESELSFSTRSVSDEVCKGRGV